MVKSVFIIHALLLAAITPSLAADGNGDAIDFDTQIQPILSDNCYQCHGPDAKQRKAKLRLDLEDTAKAKVIVAGDPMTSDLIARITTADRDERMPPPETKKTLTKPEIDLIRRWIAQGAPWKEHWAFLPPAKVKVPQPPGDDWSINEIDRFILARLQSAKLQPSRPASRERLIRRVTFDLTGLPPTLEEIDAFLADDSPDAYEKLVDRLLASPAFGERLASMWLDAARYSDSFGYQRDNDRYVWPWRDWVVNAFNKNLPYDEFLTHQIAGDLLPDAGRDEILATTFNRLHPQKVEGGSVPEEFRIEYVADRTQTVGTAFLGLTLECARCHDHKYDPISQNEYYQLTAFFDNIDEAGLYSFFTRSVPTPTLLLTDEATDKRLTEIEKQIAERQASLERIAVDRRSAFDAWLANASEAKVVGEIAHLDFENNQGGGNKSVEGRVGKAVKLSGDDGISLKVGNFTRNDPFSVSLWMNTPDVKDRAVVFHRSRAWTDAASRGYQLLIEEGKLSFSLIHFWPGNALRVKTRQPIATNEWLHVTVTYDGSSRAAGVGIFINGERAEIAIVRDNLYKNITGGGGNNIAIGQRFRDRGFTNGLVDEFRVFDRELTEIEIAQLHDGRSLTDALAAKDASDEAYDRLLTYYLSTADETYRKGLTDVKVARLERSKVADGIREIMVMREMPEQRVTHYLDRGAYKAKGEIVQPQTPSVLSRLTDEQRPDRLGLARWMTRADHPLTSRVAVNRFWQLMFGDGLVRTPEDFGRQGQPPTHPELLDWLARDFTANGWDIKRLMKLIAMSATYRQSSETSPQLLARDPQNLLLARKSSHRLPAEMLRDAALAASGLLFNKVGGAPVKPYEVEESFKPLKRDRGENLYRRSLYTYWKRTGPAPAMMVLDASKRDVCRVKRERTSTPLQAFVLMNGPQFVEAARALAERQIKRHGEADDEVIDDMFRSLTGRRPELKEREVLTSLYEKQRATFDTDAARTAAYLAVGDHKPDKAVNPARLAAMASVANALLSYDETVMKR